MTYAELVDKIRNYTEVDSNVLTSAIINGFIEDAEFRIMRDVDSDQNRRYATAPLLSGQRFINTPPGTLIVRSAQIVDSDGVGQANNRDFLEYGNASLAFVKKEIHRDENFSTDVFSVYCADGTLLAAFDSRESAIAAILQSGLEHINLH